MPGSASAGRSRRSIACTPPLWELNHERPPQCEPCHEPTHCPPLLSAAAAPLHPALRAAGSVAGHPARAAPAVAWHHLCRLPADAALQRLLRAGRVQRPDPPRAGAAELRRPAASGEPGRDPAHRRHVAAGDPSLRPARLSGGLLHGALHQRQDPGPVLRRHHAAALVQLSGAGLRLEADPGQGGGYQLAGRQPWAGLAARCHPLAAGDRGAVAVVLAHRHLHRIRLRLAALHDPAHPGGGGADPALPAGGERRSRRHPGPDLSHSDPAAGPARGGGGLHLHLLPDAGGLHHPRHHRQLHHVHRSGGLHAAGHGGQPALRRRLLAGADPHHRHLPHHRETLGGFRCALIPP
ncbi:spermidine/putrescine ABC transporter permease [Aeromonas hydrophila ML09-119]|nr:spermidine/putrescine ABC transporter permease [Aeromonas hydrophila ML09-119]